jgi:PAS domain S-box-containing protein
LLSLVEEVDKLSASLQRVPDPVALLKGLFAHLPVGLQIYERNGHCLVVNEAFRRMYGSEPPPDYNVLHDEVAAKAGVLELIHRAFAGETVSTPPHWYDPRELTQVQVTEGRRVAHQVTMFPLFNAAGEVAYVAVVVKDVTAEMRSREATQHRLDRLDAILAAMSDAVTVQNHEGRLVFANDAAARMCGFASSAELVAASPAAIMANYHMFDETGAPFTLDKLPGRIALTGAVPADVVMRVRKKGDSEERWTLVSARPVRGEDGTVELAINLFRDITERMRAEEGWRLLADATSELSASLDYEQTLEKIAQIAVPRFADGCAVDIVESSEPLRMSRLALAHLDPHKLELAHEMRRRYPPNLETPSGLARVLKEGKAIRVENVTDEMVAASAHNAEHLEMLRTIGMCSVMVVPLKARDRVLGSLTLVSAESKRRFTAHDLEMASELGRRAGLAVENSRLYREAQAAIKKRDEFLTVASHELKTPLTSVHLQVDGLMRHVARGVGGEGMRQRLDRAQGQLAKLGSLIEELLDVGRVAAGRFQIARASTNVAELLREVMARFEAAAEGAGSHLTCEAPQDLVAEVDKERIDQVLTNLLSNAVKYGQGKPVHAAAAAVGDIVRLTVRDQGIGIPPADQERIFERFERVASSRQYTGLGLGLFIVREIVRAHGGSIRVDSQPGQGATFVVELPRATPES